MPDTAECAAHMSKVIVCGNMKGGVGKTTVALNLAAGLARKGKKVCLVDNDPQGNCTAALGYTAIRHMIQEEITSYHFSSEKSCIRYM